MASAVTAGSWWGESGVGVGTDDLTLLGPAA
jgi:hypothetical protein